MQHLHVLINDSGFEFCNQKFCNQKKVINLHNKKMKPGQIALPGVCSSSMEVMLQLPAFILPALPCVQEQPHRRLPEMNPLISRKRRAVPSLRLRPRAASAFLEGAGAPGGTGAAPSRWGSSPESGDVRAGPGRAGPWRCHRGGRGFGTRVPWQALPVTAPR